MTNQKESGDFAALVTTITLGLVPALYYFRWPIVFGVGFLSVIAGGN